VSFRDKTGSYGIITGVVMITGVVATGNWFGASRSRTVSTGNALLS